MAASSSKPAQRTTIPLAEVLQYKESNKHHQAKHLYKAVGLGPNPLEGITAAKRDLRTAIGHLVLEGKIAFAESVQTTEASPLVLTELAKSLSAQVQQTHKLIESLQFTQAQVDEDKEERKAKVLYVNS